MRSRNVEKNRDILEAAGAIFTEVGYEKASMDMIAARAGVSKQTVYSHFGSKGGLFILCIQKKCEATVLNDEVMSLNGPLKEELQKLAARFLRLITSPEGLGVLRVCISSSVKHPELGQAFFRAGPQKLSEKFKKYLEAKVANGELAIENTGHASWQFFSVLQGEAVMCANLGISKECSEEDFTAYIESCVDTFLAAYQV